MKDLNEITSELDQVIEKGNEVKKALTFDILKPHQMSEFSHFHCPYQLNTDGTYAPWPQDFWLNEADLGKDKYQHHKDGFRETREFYDTGSNDWGKFKRSIGSFVEKALKQPQGMGGPKGGLPIGTVHTFEDGKQYRKESEGHWVPVGAGDHARRLADPTQMTQASHEIESHARSSKVENLLNERKQGQQKKGKKREEKAAKSTKVFEKVRRRDGGKGREVKLSKDELTTVLKQGKYALVSAGINPADEKDAKLSSPEVTQRYKALKDDLKAGGFSFSKVTGVYGDREDSFLVMAHDIDREEVIKLGEKYNQDSVIYGENGKQEMHYTVGKNTGKAHLGTGYEDATGKEDFYTMVDTPEGQIKFALNFNMDELTDLKEFAKGMIQSLLKSGVNPKIIRKVIEDLKSNWGNNE